ncbi:basic proline-rich protein-like [Mesocricetus auratus]|uniref:Basic proline-rich protein-like n=1 Tax=Mesocricetus auratus TaxID=10036 RepID=A0ABM2W4B2_MESAU|nr:basic proline-rich protein-like [Mesocricetus auratus]
MHLQVRALIALTPTAANSKRPLPQSGSGKVEPTLPPVNRALKFSPATVTLRSPRQDERKLTQVGEGRRGLRAGARQAAAARTCSRSPEQLRAAAREARTQSAAGAEGAGTQVASASSLPGAAGRKRRRGPELGAGQGPAGLGARTPPEASDSLPPSPPPPPSAQLPRGQEGPCPPRPLPPRLHKVAGRRPPTRPEGRGPRGSPADKLHRSGHAPGTQGCTGCGWVGGGAVHPALLESVPPSAHPTCLGHPRDGKCGAGVPQPPVHPVPPSPAHLALKVNLSAAGALWFRQLVQVRVPGARSSPAARRRAPRATRHQPGPPRPPFPPPSAPSPFSASRPQLPPPLSPSPAPGARASAVTPRPLPAAPGRGQHPPPADRPRRPTAAPAGKRSPCRSHARLAGICSSMYPPAGRASQRVDF